jgi:hypothetical protein
MNIALLALSSFIGLGFFTVVLQYFFFKEEIKIDDFMVVNKKKEDQTVNSDDIFNAYELIAPWPTSYWVHLKRPGLQIEVNDEVLFNMVEIDQIITIEYKKSYWKMFNKEFIMGFQVLKSK